MEAAPKEGIAFAGGYSPCFEKGLAERVELTMIIDHIGFFFHW